MDIEIKRLAPELTDDYFDFFNNRAFTDNPPWGGCYCIGWQLGREAQDRQDRAVAQSGGGEAAIMAILAEEVRAQIASGQLRGYLAYVDGLCVGWCNVNDRANLPADSVMGDYLHAPAERREKVVLCFEIAPEYRGRGVATALLERALSDAAAEGCAAVVAFPQVHEAREKWDYTGPIRLYEKAGFVRADGPDGRLVMRRELG